MREAALFALGLPFLARGFTDCVGQVLKDEDCVWEAGGYTKCSDWVGDGTCDGGFTISDNDRQIYLNCPLHDNDGGDCDDNQPVKCKGESMDGECKVPGEGEIVDCSGQVLTDKDCEYNWGGKKYTTCEEWKNDGSCDAGQYYSDNLKAINFNCAAHNWDGGDCKKASPTQRPTPESSAEPTPEPTPLPTSQPTPSPTNAPTHDPSVHPTPEPTQEPTQLPTHAPTQAPTLEPTEEPTPEPTPSPSHEPTEEPTPMPTNVPEENTVAAIWKALKLVNADKDGNAQPLPWGGCVEDNTPEEQKQAWVETVSGNAGKAWVRCHDDEPVSISELYITGLSDLQKLPDTLNELLRKLPQLEVIVFKSNGIKKLDQDFSHLGNLKILDLSKNKITEVLPNSLFGNFKLEELYLGKNKIKKNTFPNEFLMQNKELKIFNMESNKLKTPLLARLFRHNTKLEQIYLQGNKWKFVHPQLFLGLAELKVLRIPKSKEKNLSGNFFATNAKLAKLDMDGWKLKCAPELPPLGTWWSYSKDQVPGGDLWEDNLLNNEIIIMYAKKMPKNICPMCTDVMSLTECELFKDAGTCGDHDGDDECACTCHKDNKEDKVQAQCYDTDPKSACDFAKQNNFCNSDIFKNACRKTCDACQN